MVMLTIQSSPPSTQACVPNIIPCRIHYTGPTKVNKRYWAPSKDKDDVQTTHFRGRKLRGRTVKLPDGYQGLIFKTTGRFTQQSVSHVPTSRYDYEDEADDDGQDESPEPVGILEKISSFDELLVWGHDQIPESDDAFVKNVEEWIYFAEAIHANPIKSQMDKNQAENDTTNK